MLEPVLDLGSNRVPNVIDADHHRDSFPSYSLPNSEIFTWIFSPTGTSGPDQQENLLISMRGAVAIQSCGVVGHLRNDTDNVVSSSTCLRLEKDLWQRQTSLEPSLGLLVLLGQPDVYCSWV